MRNNDNKSVNKYRFIPYIIMAFSAIILYKYANLSFCASDEAFYASTTNRFLQGDAIFVHEWFPTQLVSLILLPIQSLFVKIVGINEGILLFMRYVYIVFSFICAVIIYNLLKLRSGVFASVCCSMFVIFYAHLNIATMSYYTLSFHFFLISMLLYITGYEKLDTEIGKNILDISKGARLFYILAGITFALAVLSLPSLAVVYFLIVFLGILLYVADLILEDKFPLILNRIVLIIVPALIYSLIGIIIPALAVLIFVLPKSGIMGIIENLEYVLSDEEHITSLVGPFKKFFQAVIDVYKKDVYLSVLLTMVSIVIYVIRDILKKQIKNIDIACNIVVFVDLIMFMYYVSTGIGHTGYLSTAMILFSIPLFFLTKKKDYPMLIMVYIGGLVFSMVYSYSSNGDLYVLSIGHSIAAIAAICFVWNYSEEKKNQSALVQVFFAIILIICILLTATLRFINIYRDAPIPKLTETITEGPAKGLRTTAEHKLQYDTVLSTIKNNETDGNVFFTKLLPWGYLATDMRCGAPTTWRTKFNSDRLRLYYNENPDRLPDVIFVMPDDIGAYDSCGDVVADPTPNENEMGGFLEEYILENAYESHLENGILIYSK